MREFDFIKKKFEEKHSEINDYEYLEKYINFLISYDLSTNSQIDYNEKHHILPRSTFPEYKDEDWNIIELSYEDHRLVHLWIFKSINTRKYQRPLNWMMNQYKNSEEVSNSAKLGWISLKNNKDKYKEWCNKKSNSMKKISSEEQRRRANIFWTNISDERYLDFCKEMKNYWTEERKLQKSTEMKNFYSHEENVKKKSQESKKIWELRNDEFRENFRNKMDEINKNEDKRKDAGEKIKNIWKTEDYLKKMKSRKHREGTKIKLISNNGIETIYDTMQEFSNIYNFSLHLIRKYRNTNICISDSDLSEKNESLEGCKIETLN
jgi:hypothetical protein